VFVGSNTLNVSANDVRVVGISVGSQSFKIGGSLSLQVFENCSGGNSSFGLNTVCAGTFINCVAGIRSFGYGGTGAATGTFINCKAGEKSFGFQSTGASGTFIDCEADSASFGSSAEASGLFINCKAGQQSFGHSPTVGMGAATGTFINCRCPAFPPLTAPTTGAAIQSNCLDGNGDIINGRAPAA
jgi:hypothetical protein